MQRLNGLKMLTRLLYRNANVRLIIWASIDASAPPMANGYQQSTCACHSTRLFSGPLYAFCLVHFSSNVTQCQMIDKTLANNTDLVRAMLKAFAVMDAQDDLGVLFSAYEDMLLHGLCDILLHKLASTDEMTEVKTVRILSSAHMHISTAVLRCHGQPINEECRRIAKESC